MDDAFEFNYVLTDFLSAGSEISDREMLKSPTKIVGSSIFLCRSISLPHVFLHSVKDYYSSLENYLLYCYVIPLYVSDNFSCSEVFSI